MSENRGTLQQRKFCETFSCLNSSGVLLALQLSILSLIHRARATLLAATVETEDEQRDGNPGNDSNDNAVPEGATFLLISYFIILFNGFCTVLKLDGLKIMLKQFMLFFVNWLN